ncbi:MAG TPA: ABC transporter permease [Steroidobacteraceae bacterium]|nr:ABC transporter permease [Steroidobacteraceae bacterium]
MNAIYVLWLRALKHFVRSRAQIVSSLGQPMLYLLALGFGLGPVFQRAGQGNYIQFIAPGVITMTVLFSAMFSGIGLIWDRQFGFLKETLVAPVPRLAVMAGRTLGGATVALMQGLLVLLLCMLFGFRPASLMAVPEALFYMALIAVVFCALGTALGSRLENMQAFPMVTSFVMMPMFFLSGALFPLDGLPGAMKYVTAANPLTYGVDGVRGALIGAWHFGAGIDSAVLVGVGALFVALGAWSFSRIQL